MHPPFTTPAALDQTRARYLAEAASARRLATQLLELGDRDAAAEIQLLVETATARAQRLSFSLPSA